jgi:ubiquinone/menaquinone biosynthesis C-methylase UbiE/uncharacterized protein YbaR (Trm112 family)
MDKFSMLRCPTCKGRLNGTEALTCTSCQHTFTMKNGIPILLTDSHGVETEQDTREEKDYYEAMFGGLRGPEDGHCIVYGHDSIYRFMDELERGTVLEVGCGAGHHSVNLARRGFQVTSIDLSVNGLLAAQARASREQQDVFFLCGDVKHLPFEDNQFDVCFCSLILHHFVGLDGIVKELARVTKRHFVAFEVNGLEPISFFRFNVLNPTIGVRNISKNQRALMPKDLEKALAHNGFLKSVIQYEDIHHYIGTAPDSMQARMIASYRKVMRMLPEQYSKNKFLMLASK